MNQEAIINSLKDNIYTVIFRKVDGTIRNMRCTLKPDLMPLGSEVHHKIHGVTVWDLDNKDWRSFRVDSVQTMIKDNGTPKLTESDIKRRIIMAWEQSVNDQANELDKAFAVFKAQMRRTSDDGLMYLIYWNNGHSGPHTAEQIAFYKEELNSRNNPYSDDVSDKLQEILDEYR